MSRNDEQVRAEAAQKMGMKLREVISVASTEEGDVVTTHDGQRTLIRPDGSMEFGVPEAAEPTDADGPAEVEQPKKVARGGSGRSGGTA